MSDEKALSGVNAGFLVIDGKPIVGVTVTTDKQNSYVALIACREIAELLVKQILDAADLAFGKKP